MHRLHPAKLRAAWWAHRAARRAARSVDRAGLDGANAPAPPPLPEEALSAVEAVLRRRGDSCLVQAVVLQAWERAHGRRRDLIIGVTAPGDFSAHAWLEGDPADDGEGRFSELIRIPAPR